MNVMESKARTDESKAFNCLVDRVLSVPHCVIQNREAEYQAQTSQNPRRRGPKRKTTRTSTEGPASSDRV
jgi:hypothetical protein